MLSFNYKKYLKSVISGYVDKSSKSKILDVGCGIGNYTSLFCNNKNQVFGVDIQNVIEYTCFNFIFANGTKLPFVDNFFDLVVSFDVIEHVENDFAFLKEIKRVSKDKILIGTPNRNRLSNQLKKVIGKKVEYPLDLGNKPPLGACIHLREYDKSGLKKLLEMAGFSDIYIHHLWIGLRLPLSFEIGITVFPGQIGVLSQYWLAEGRVKNNNI